MTEHRQPSFSSTYRPTGAGLPASTTGGRQGPPGAGKAPNRPFPPAPEVPRQATTTSRTALPPRQKIHCYECAYEFNLTGRMTSTYCPKCRTTLDLAGYTVDSECREVLKTLGRLVVTPRGSINSTQSVAQDIELAGRVINSAMEAYGLLVIQPGAYFRRSDIVSQDLRIDAGAAVNFRSPAVYRNVEIAGSFRGPLYATGTILIRSTGSFSGILAGEHLVVEDGAALQAEVNIGAAGLELVNQKKSELAASPPMDLDKELITVALPPEPEEPAAT